MLIALVLLQNSLDPQKPKRVCERVEVTGSSIAEMHCYYVYPKKPAQKTQAPASPDGAAPTSAPSTGPR